MNFKKILIIGFGSIGRRHFKNIKSILPKCEIIILRSKKNSIKINGAKQVFSYNEALSMNPEIAFLCNPSSYHIESAEKILNSNIHIFFEKPLANSSKNIDNFLNKIKKKNIKTTIGYNLRYNDALIKTRKILNDKKYGKVLCASVEVGQFLPNWRPKKEYKFSVSAKKNLGGGALLELSHELDYLMWIFGNPLSVYATIKKVSQLEIDVEDLVLADIEMSNSNHTFPCTVHLDFLQHKKSRNCKIIFEHGVLYLNLINSSIEIYKNEKKIFSYNGSNDTNYTYINEVKDFFECIQKNTQPKVTLDQGIQTLKLIDDMMKSSKLEKRVFCAW
tara:strand:+ start:2557 stop:3552 length:996 start_codon:yes stop_codon:yes gene_type:complete